MNKGQKLEDLEVYKIAMEIGEIVWNIVSRWDYFTKKTLDGQYVEAGDSIAFNISEGYGRFFIRRIRISAIIVVVRPKKLLLLP